MDPENAHHLVMKGASILGEIPFSLSVDDACLQSRVFGIKFKNPIGLAAGLDKDGRAFRFFENLGFGAVELGTVTSEYQEGNPRPRIFRFPQSHAMINRMGFPSVGVDDFEDIVNKYSKRTSILGINIGKAKSVPIDKALSDYLYSFSRLSQYGDYFVLNISSPNTPELRKLQEPERLKDLFMGLEENNPQKKPLLIKIAPDLESAQLEDILKVCVDCKVKGIIATNTTFSRDGLVETTTETGGLSGLPLKNKSLDFVKRIYSQLGETLPVVGVGGIFSSDDVIDYIRAGASLVQIYTGFIYNGPMLSRQICTDLIKFCKTHELENIKQIRGLPK